MLMRIKNPKNQVSHESNLASKDSLQVWHEKLGHQNKRHVSQFLKLNGIDVKDDQAFCEACIEGKQKRGQFISRSQRSKEPGAVINADLCGKMECPSLGNAQYFVCFTCDYSRFRIVYFLKNKSEVSQKVK